MGQGAANGGREVDGNPDIERLFTAVSIEQGPIEELPRGNADKKAGEGKRDLCYSCPEVSCDRRESRQVHIDGEGSDGGQEPQDKDEQKASCFWRGHIGSKIRP